MNQETFSLIYLLKSEIYSKISQNNFLCVPKQLRHYISLCNSLSIKLLQSGSFSEIQPILKKILKADSLLCTYGTQADKFWQGRLLSWVIHTFYYWITSQMQLAMQLMYKTHLLIEEINESGGILNSDLKLSINFVSFLVLWTADRLENCENFLIVASKCLEFRDIKKKNKLNLIDAKILIAIGQAALCFRVSGNYKQGVRVLNEAYEGLKTNSESFMVLKKFISVSWKELKKPYSSEAGESNFFHCGGFEKVVLDTFISPFIEEEVPGFDKDLRSTIKSSVSHEDKGSTRSTFSKSSGTDSKLSPNISKFYQIRPLPMKVKIYSPTLAKRPCSQLKTRKLNIRPRSSGKYY